MGRRGAGPAVRAADVAAGDVGDRREPVRAPLRPSPHRPAADRGDGLVLPRHRRRDPRRARRGPGGAPPGRPRAAGRRRRDDRGRAVQRPRRPRPAAGPGRCRLPADGAGADQHRDRAARRRLPRGRPGDHPPPRGAAGHRRDAHAVRRAGWRARAPGGSIPTSWWSGSRSAAASLRGVRHDGGDRRPALRADARARDRRRRSGRDPHRERTRPGRDQGDALDLSARGGLRGRRTPGRAVHRRRRRRHRASTRCPGTCSGSAAGRSTGSALRRATARPQRRPSTRTSRGSCTCGR